MINDIQKEGMTMTTNEKALQMSPKMRETLSKLRTSKFRGSFHLSNKDKRYSICD